MRDYSGAFYAVLLTTGLVFLAYQDSLLLRLIHPDQPEIHGLVGLVLLYCIIIAGFTCTLYTVRGSNFPDVVRFGVMGLLALSLLGLVLIFVLPPEYTEPPSYVLMVLMLVLQNPNRGL